MFRLELIKLTLVLRDLLFQATNFIFKAICRVLGLIELFLAFGQIPRRVLYLRQLILKLLNRFVLIDEACGLFLDLLSVDLVLDDQFLFFFLLDDTQFGQSFEVTLQGAHCLPGVRVFFPEEQVAFFDLEGGLKHDCFLIV